jgi:signal transduction histidine kinase
MTALAAAADRAETIGFLRGLPLFSGLGDRELEQIALGAEQRRVAAGSIIMREGSPGDGLYVVWSGELEVTRKEGSEDVVLAVYGSGAFLGEMSLVADGPRSASVRAARESVLLFLEAAEFKRILAENPSVSLTIMRAILTRLRSTEASLQQHARLATLGTLAAGLAHELNNPASAIQRSVEHLRGALDPLERCAERAAEHGVDLEPVRGLGPRPPVDSREEERLSGWMQHRRVPQFNSIALSLAECGWSTGELEALLESYPPEQRTIVFDWLASRCVVTTLLDEVTRGAGALTEITAAVKAYAYLGAAPLQVIDIRQSLENTLVILRSRLKEGVEVVRAFEDGLPEIEGYGSDLNQLWTNIIANAVDAMEGAGTLELQAFRQADTVVVRVIDSGHGIPDQVRDRIFDPFFTTRPPGSGSGLGLHVAYGIVEKHRGRIRVDSRPGRTEFSIILPLTSGNHQPGAERVATR